MRSRSVRWTFESFLFLSTLGLGACSSSSNGSQGVGGSAGAGNTPGAGGSQLGTGNTPGAGGLSTGAGNATGATGPTGPTGMGGSSPASGGNVGALGGTPGLAGSPGTGNVPGSGGSTPVGSGGAPDLGGTTGVSGAANTGGMSTGTGGATQTGTGCLKGTGDYSKAGPYTVKTKSVDLASMLSGAASPTTYTIFYPDGLDASCPAPLISWGNGTGVTGSQVYGFFNNNAASWGMIVIASDNSNAAASPFIATGVDYMLAQNKDSTSEFFGKLSGRAGTSGHSQGAIAATTATTDAAVTAEVQVEGGGIPKAGIAFLALSGTADNVVTTGPPTSSYGAATGPSMLAIYTGADHVTTPTLAGAIQGNAGSIQFMRFYTAWFRCFLGDDSNACAMFKGGASCGVCKDPNWDSIKTKNL